jgi:hypothetical protein
MSAQTIEKNAMTFTIDRAEQDGPPVPVSVTEATVVSAESEFLNATVHVYVHALGQDRPYLVIDIDGPQDLPYKLVHNDDTEVTNGGVR